MSGVSRFKICTYELGDGTLGPDELNRIHEALQTEAKRLRNIGFKLIFASPNRLYARRSDDRPSGRTVDWDWRKLI